jgi:hypothetical protein
MFTSLPPMDAAQSSYSTARKSDCHAAAIISYFADGDVSRG